MPALSPSGEPHRWIAASLIALLVCGAILLVGWPAIHGFWARDDLTQLAYVRLLGTPWPLFVQDHFPVPGSIFRPLGFTSLWLSEQLFGHDHIANTIADLLLHGLITLALYRLMRVVATRTTALACCLMFALLPVVLVTVMSWSNRFDLLAVLFTLVSLRAICDWIGSQRWLHFVTALIAMLAALLSKESGAIVVVAAAMLIAEAGMARRIDWRRALLGIAAIGLLGISYVIWRRTVLGSGGNAITSLASLVETLARGTAIWWQQLTGYLSSALPLWLLSGLLLLLALAIIAAIVRPDRSHGERTMRGPILLAAIVVVILPGVLQAPIAVLNSIPASTGMSAVELGMQARLVYTSCAGFALLLALLISANARTARNVFTIALFVFAGCVGLSSHHLAVAHAERSSAIAAQAINVVDYVATHALPSKPCRVVILGYQPPPEWANVTPLDSVIKALAPDIDKVSTCLFANEHLTYIHQFAAGRVTPADALPWQARVIGGKPIKRLAIGGLEIAYLVPPQEFSRHDREEIMFLSIDTDRVTDVSAAVRAGTRAVQLQ